MGGGEGMAMVQTWPVAAAGVAVAVEPLPAVAPGAPGAPEKARVPTTADAADGAAAAPGSADAAATMAVNPPSQATPAAPVGQATTLAAPSPAAALPHAGSGAGSMGGALVALLLVVGLILGLAWLARRLPGLGTTAGNRHLKLVGSLSIGPRERVVVVDVGGTQLLLSTGAGGTRTLHTLGQPLPEPGGATTASPFAQVLAQHFGKKN